MFYIVHKNAGAVLKGSSITILLQLYITYYSLWLPVLLCSILIIMCGTRFSPTVVVGILYSYLRTTAGYVSSSIIPFQWLSPPFFPDSLMDVSWIFSQMKDVEGGEMRVLSALRGPFTSSVITGMRGAKAGVSPPLRSPPRMLCIFPVTCHLLP